MNKTKIKMGTFRRGVHPAGHKTLTEALAIKTMPDPSKVILPLIQHIGAPCEPLVKAGAQVQVGQKIAGSEKFVSSPVHASISGRVTAIAPWPHPIGIEVMSIVIERDETASGILVQDKEPGRQNQSLREPLSPTAPVQIQAESGAGLNNLGQIREQNKGFSLENADKQQIRLAVQEAGIVGLGGAAFPAHVKLSPPEDKPIDTVIFNGCECEPYLTADHRVMLEYTDECIGGLKIIMKAVGASKGFIGIEINKPDAVKKMLEQLDRDSNKDGYDISVFGLKAKYPQGAEKMLIKAILGREVPSGGLPMDVGALVSNAGTAVAISRAVTRGEPLTRRVVTVTGGGINNPANLLVPLGATFEEVIKFCGGLHAAAAKVIMGGPMMGLSQYTLEAPVVKATSGILVLTEKEAEIPDEAACIRCARCVDHCPMGLLPVELARLVKADKRDRLLEYKVKDCIECGCCAYLCPSKLPLVQLIKLGKLKVK